MNKAFVGFSRRAESIDRETLVKTFVDIGPLFAVLSTRDHQVVYGRRGTGKTHALLYVTEQAKKNRDIAVYIDLRYIGSSGGIYGDANYSLAQRATRLLLDVLGSVHGELLEIALSLDLDLSRVGPALDKLAAAITELEVLGETTRETENQTASESTTGNSVAATFSKVPAASIGWNESEKKSEEQRTHYTEKGTLRYRVHFGSVSSALKNLVSIIKPAHLVIVLDEWSSLPLELQPYLADLIRRAIFPVQGITVKIAAIEQRTLFKLGGGSDYTGIEVGADASADVDLDDYMVFDNNEARAVEFFQELVFKHYASEVVDGKPEFDTSKKLIQAAFTQTNAFDDFVKSAEGVPRDAFNVLSLAAQRGMNDKISIPTIRVAARTWYQRDKEGAIKSDENAQALLHWIIDEVIAHRKARAFLLPVNSRHPIIDSLFDARLLHIIKKGLSGQEKAGARYDAYKLDYGCYVDLLATKAAPMSLYGDDEDTASAVIVPTDDYRAIRRAILDLNTFEARIKKGKFE